MQRKCCTMYTIRTYNFVIKRALNLYIQKWSVVLNSTLTTPSCASVPSVICHWAVISALLAAQPMWHIFCCAEDCGSEQPETHYICLVCFCLQNAGCIRTFWYIQTSLKYYNWHIMFCNILNLFLTYWTVWWCEYWNTGVAFGSAYYILLTNNSMQYIQNTAFHSSMQYETFKWIYFAVWQVRLSRFPVLENEASWQTSFTWFSQIYLRDGLMTNISLWINKLSINLHDVWKEADPPALVGAHSTDWWYFGSSKCCFGIY